MNQPETSPENSEDSEIEALPEEMFDDSEMTEEMLAAVAMWDLAKRNGPPRPKRES